MIILPEDDHIVEIGWAKYHFTRNEQGWNVTRDGELIVYRAPSYNAAYEIAVEDYITEG